MKYPEGFSIEYRGTLRKAILSRINPGFLKSRPSIPDSLDDVNIQEVFGGLGYLVIAKKN